MVYTVPQGFHDWDVRRPLSCGAMKRTFLAREEPIRPASVDWGNGVKLASYLMDYLGAEVSKREAKVRVLRQHAYWQASGPGFSHQTMPHEQEEDDPERVWCEFWAHLERFIEVVPCIADFNAQGPPQRWRY
ncbi:hypothetical protein GY45DRAFT_1326464 [Cubamyces sp. BRFM 1775]|nr:hypothetical protein GY45DRAFT_1326464 [Cubamyces sp. BRFM 1775]